MRRFSLVLALFLVVTSMALATSMIPKEVAIDEKKDGTEMVLFLGQTLSLSLAENPSTGYRWTVEDYKPTVLEQLETIFKPASTSKPAPVGSGGTKIFGFLAKKVGETPLVLEYNRPWAETAKAEKTFSMKIKVQKAGSPHDVGGPNGPNGPKPTHPICWGLKPGATSQADSPAGVSKSGSEMGTGMTLGDLATALKDLTGPALKYNSCIKFRPGTPVEYLGLIINIDGRAPRCLNQKLAMTNKALRVMVDRLVSHYGKKGASKELAFLVGGMPQPGFVQVTLIGTGLGLPFNVETGEPMGKLTGKL